MNESPVTHHEYTLTLRSDADYVSPGVYAYMEVVRVRGASGHAVMLVNRQGGDLPERAVGLFGAVLPVATIAALANALDHIKWGALPQPQGRDVGASSLSIDYARGTRIIQRQFQSDDGEFLDAIAPVMGIWGQVDAKLFANPLRAIDIAVARTEHGFKLIIRNVGTGPVLLAAVGQAAAHARHAPHGVVAVALAAEPPRPFADPPAFTPVALQAPADTSHAVPLGPGRTYEIETIAWVPPQPGRYLVRASWEDYVGPEVDPKTVMPMIPEPDHAVQDPRPYVMRGAAFSKTVAFVVDGKRR